MWYLNNLNMLMLKLFKLLKQEHIHVAKMNNWASRRDRTTVVLMTFFPKSKYEYWKVSWVKLHALPG